MNMWSLALTFFLVANPVGNTPAILSIIKGFNLKRQRIILLREAFFALVLALFFQYAGEVFLDLLHIETFAVTIAGGVLLFLVSLSMIFPKPLESIEPKDKQEPFIVPIATPILSGPGLLAIIMLKSTSEMNNLKLTLAILVAWIGVIGVLAIAPYLQYFLGKRGLAALEQVMGMILAMISTEMILKGTGLLLEGI